MNSIYQDEARMRAAVEGGQHRDIIGGMWDEIGALQFDWLVSRGMRPEHRLLDIGCGAGRLAVRAAPYLNPGNYFGQDRSEALIDAARAEIEAVGCANSIGANTFLVTEDFKAPGETNFDFLLAQSVFTHLPLDMFGLCLDRVASRAAKGARFYATFFTAPEGVASFQHERGDVVTYADKDPFHFSVRAIIALATKKRWRANFIGEWGHPRDQQMFEFGGMDP